MAQTRVSQFFKRKETAQIKRKQTSINVFCLKNSRPSFDVADNEVTCLEPKKTEEKRPFRKPTGQPIATTRASLLKLNQPLRRTNLDQKDISYITPII